MPITPPPDRKGPIVKLRLHSQFARAFFAAPALLAYLIGFASRAAADTTAAEALATIQVLPEFQIEQVAAEPVVMDPVCLAFDEKGRAFVVEMQGYPIAPTEESQFPGKIVMLEDTNGDGVYDKSTVFADKFQYADSILPYKGGLLVASPPNLLFLKDTDGDGVADKREILLTGFEVGNAQHNFNGLTYGIDNWIYGGTGGNSGRIYWPDQSDNAMPIRYRDFRMDFEKKKLEFVGASSGGFGVTFDDFGHMFSTHNMKPFLNLVIRGHYLERNKYISLPRTLNQVADYREGDLTRIYPIGVQQPRLNHPEQSGYFSGSCGVMYYGGNAFPAGFNGNLFVCDVVLNLVHRGVLRAEGPAIQASRADVKKEFLASSDRSFRPVNMTVGPDGALYVLDFHRDVIEHPEWIPKELMKDMDVNAGKDKGRIYRITPKGGLPRATPKFDRANVAGVVNSLLRPNKWWRDTAQRLLVDWQDPAAAPLIEKLFSNTDYPPYRAQELWTLRALNGGKIGKDGTLGALKENLLIKALSDPYPGVRENALILSEDGLAKSPKRIEAVLKLASDEDARVRMQAALTIGELAGARDGALAAQVDAALLKIATSDVENEWTRIALVSALGERPLPMFQSLGRSGEGAAALTAGKEKFLNSLAQIIGARKEQKEVEPVLEMLSAQAASRTAFVAASLDGLAAGLEREPEPDKRLPAGTVAKFEKTLRPMMESESPKVLKASWRVSKALGLETSANQKKMLEKAAKVALDNAAPLNERLDQAALLEFAPFSESEETLFKLLNIRNPKEVQMAAIEQLARVGEKSIAERLLKMWIELSPEVRVTAGNILLYRISNQELLLTALENKELLIGQLNLDLERRRALLRSHNPEIRKRAEALFTDAGVVTRARAIEKMRPALSLKGDPTKGHDKFKDVCAKCHKISGEGAAVGPDLTDIYRKSAETLMQDILDPNAAFAPEFMSVTLETKDGEIHNGLVHEQSDASLTLREAENKDTVIQRSQIKEMRSTGLSLMPEELETGFDHQSFADLLAFLQQPR